MKERWKRQLVELPVVHEKMTAASLSKNGSSLLEVTAPSTTSACATRTRERIAGVGPPRLYVVVTCRGHGGQYDVTNGNMLVSPEFGVAAYAVKVVGKILIAVGGYPWTIVQAGTLPRAHGAPKPDFLGEPAAGQGYCGPRKAGAT